MVNRYQLGETLTIDLHWKQNNKKQKTKPNKQTKKNRSSFSFRIMIRIQISPLLGAQLLQQLQVSSYRENWGPDDYPSIIQKT